ncbi:MAG: T9SS type A sorting domain-containing protein [Lewinellaceae bacterium]|nr:T9SS type A sorting domain-containing protein [Lewinellaceae bacterium]
MKQLVLFCLLLLSLTHQSTAQITITNSVFPVVVDTLHYAFGNQPGAINQIFTPPGFGQQWNLSNLQATQTWNQVMKNPQTGTAQASFPGASILYNPLNSNNEVYLQVTGNQVLDMGYYGSDELGLGLNLLFKKAPVLEQSWAPVNFFDIHQSTSNVLTAFDAPIAPPILLNLIPTPILFASVTYQRLGAIDASGTLAIPGGTFDVLRKKQTEYKSTAVDVKVAPLGWIDISTIGGQQILPLGTDTITTFHFLNNVSKEAIAICTLNTAQNAVTGVQYKALNTPTPTFTPSLNQPLWAYPNPVQNTLFVHFTTDAGKADQWRLLNVQGNVVLEQTVEANEAENGISISVANVPPGIYTLILQRNGISVGRTSVVKI